MILPLVVPIKNSLSTFKESTRKLTTPHLKTGMKATRLRIVTTSPCSFPTPKRGDVGLKLVESRLMPLLPGCRYSLGSLLYCFTSSSLD